MRNSFFAVWNESPPSKQVHKDGCNLYQAIVLIAEEGLGIKIIKGV